MIFVPFGKRKAALVVLGQAGTRTLAYQQMAAAGNLLGTLGIQEILDVGPAGEHPSAISGIPVKRMGLMPAEELPALFSQARFGFVTHEWLYLARSSVLAGYCAQGTIPVMTRSFPRECDGLKPGVHVVTPRTVQAAKQAGWESCSRAVWTWYMGHRVRRQAEFYANWMGGRP